MHGSMLAQHTLLQQADRMLHSLSGCQKEAQIFGANPEEAIAYFKSASQHCTAMQGNARRRTTSPPAGNLTL